ncbi:MAG: helix-turn-helix transcriptional regulator [Bacteroides sp.]|nr:helix-turn-helix transcriptional regulator [Bacteroides sp.]MCM1388800.1 helix-turn-helix transcriptional regulator [Bacteroides sp.]
MGTKLLNIETITEYNDMLGVETLHPLVSVIDLSKAQPMKHMRHTFSFYVVFLKDEKNCELVYGCQRYDYQKGSVVCLAPGQVIGIEDNGETFQPKGWALCFHPDLTRGTSLGSHIKEYSYFSYQVNEALHLSQKEREIFVDCLHKINHELEHGIDRLSRSLIATNIELLLDYCLRFYERQFVTREHANNDILTRFETLLDKYFESGRAQQKGLPSVKWCAGELCLSPNYFGDLMKKETGKSAKEYIQLKVMDIAKERILNPEKSISQVAYELGFQYPQHFTRLFKKVVGQNPNDYKGQTITA